MKEVWASDVACAILPGRAFQPLLTDPVCVLSRTGLLRARHGIRLAAIVDQLMC